MSNLFSYDTKPSIFYKRTKFNMPHRLKTTANLGEIFPVDCQEVYPGDGFSDKINMVYRTSSPLLRPIMDDLFLDMYSFFVPSRLCYKNWSQIFGENKTGYWTNPSPKSAPMINKGEVAEKSVLSYFGIPVGTKLSEFPVNALPFRAFALIYNEWFRDQNVIAPVNVQLGDSNSSERANADLWTPTNYLGKLPIACKIGDKFTRSLPAPQKNSEPVPISASGLAPVIGTKTKNDNITPITFSTSFPGLESQNVYGFQLGTDPDLDLISFINTNAPANAMGMSLADVYPNNLYADLSQLTAINVNDLRFAFQLQKMYEKDARGGTRYVEYLQEHFGVISPDARLQRPEYLGGKRNVVTIHQAMQTTGSSTENNALGEVGAYSLSSGQMKYGKSFVEHGYIITVGVFRQFHTYQQGIEKYLTRENRTDFYDPVFAHIGEQPIYASELFSLGSNTGNVFGYQEAWVDLRKRTNLITGQLNSSNAQALDIWHLGDEYSNAPLLNEEFIKETPIYLDRCLSVPHTTQDQFLIDVYHDKTAVRVLPLYSTPGLIDHM